jgi:hypothetical protein
VTDSVTPRNSGSRARVDAALVILCVGFSFSLAANLLWTWPGGPVRILGGALASLALPGAIHLWPKIPLAAPVAVRFGARTVRVPVMRIVRALSMTGIAAMAAFTTFSHASALLTAHGETPILATLYPVMTELLVVMGVLARNTEPTESTSALTARQAHHRLYLQLGTTTIPRRPAAKPRPERARRTEPEVPVKTALSPQEWARQNWPVNGGEIRLATGCSKGYAYKVAAEVKAEQEAAS